MKTARLIFAALLVMFFSFSSPLQAASQPEQFRNEVVKERVKSTLTYPNGETVIERDEEFETTRSVPVVVEVKYVKVAGFFRPTKEVGEAKEYWQKYMKCPYETFLADNGLTVRQAEKLPAGRKLFFREKYLKEGYEKVFEKNEGLLVELVEVRKELSMTKELLAEVETKLSQVVNGTIDENAQILGVLFQEAKQIVSKITNWFKSICGINPTSNSC